MNKSIKKNSIFRKCAKSGKIVGINYHLIQNPVFFIPMGLIALVWFCIRVLPKPARASYPCQKLALPLAGTFLGFCASWVTTAFSLKAARNALKKHQPALFLAFSLVFAISLVTMINFTHIQVKAGPTNSFSQTGEANAPIGTAKGIIPGRVAWAHNPNASTYNGTGSPYDERYNDQELIDEMMEESIIAISSKSNIAMAWDTLFKDFNKRKHGRNEGYSSDEKIAFKINLNNSGNENALDASPQTVKSILRQLINTVGVPQENITLYDCARPGKESIAHVENYCTDEFPDVKYNDFGSTVRDALQYSLDGSHANQRAVAEAVVNADYLINMALLKRHCTVSQNWKGRDGQTGVTLNAKNHFGSISGPGRTDWLHYNIRDWQRPGTSNYTPLVDMLSNEYLGQNTIINIIDGLYSAAKHNGSAIKWNMAPFNGDYPKSIFVSQDVIALESVGFDFLQAEMELVAKADNYLHEAAQIGNPPSGTDYLGKELQSLGVHEHWNNKDAKQYSRNLGTGQGIELYKVRSDITVTYPSQQQINSIHRRTSEEVQAAGRVFTIDGKVVDNST